MAIFRKCILTKNDCYKKGAKLVPNGIVVHSTGCNNPYLRRYISPDDGIIGKPSTNHWNASGITKCVHFMIGKDSDGNVQCYQTLPLDMKPWGCGSGRFGSYNNSRIQFEIQEDNLKDREYFDKAFMKAIKLCSYLCRKYNISYSSIQSHHEAYLEGYATNHGDCDNWLKVHKKDMDWFREEVRKQIEEDEKVYFKTTINLNMREKPSKRGAVLQVVPKGQKVLYLGKHKTVDEIPWRYCQKNGVKGWMSRNYLEKL